MSAKEKQHVKCFGGANHGDVVLVTKDQVGIMLYRHAAGSVVNFRRSAEPQRLSGPIATYYTRRIIKLPDGWITFFAPEGMSDFQVLSEVLGA